MTPVINQPVATIKFGEGFTFVSMQCPKRFFYADFHGKFKF
jgi:hypothetical protein